MKTKTQKTIEKITQKVRISKQLKTKAQAFLFGLVVVPVTSIGAGMTIEVDQTAVSSPEPIVVTDTIINLDENIIINFTEPVEDTVLYQEKIGIYPASNVQYFWGNDGQRVTIVPKGVWRSQTEYSFIFPHNIYDDSNIGTIFTFHTADYPRVQSVYERSNTGIVAPGEKLIFDFSDSAVKYDLHAVIRPQMEIAQQYDAKNNQLYVEIKEDTLIRDVSHTITVFAKHQRQEDNAFFPVGSHTFEILAEEPENWPEEHEERLDIAEKTTRAQISHGKYIDVNLDASITTLFEDAKVVARFINSPGAVETPTPTGSFEIYNKDPYALSEMFQVFLPYWMAFTEDGKYGFHDLIVWPEGHEEMPGGGKESSASIGNAVSPGCVRHNAKNSQFIYEWTDVGTQVIIY